MVETDKRGRTVRVGCSPVQTSKMKVSKTFEKEKNDKGEDVRIIFSKQCKTNLLIFSIRVPKVEG